MKCARLREPIKNSILFWQIQICLCHLWFVWISDALSLFTPEPVNYYHSQFIYVKALYISSNGAIFAYGDRIMQNCWLDEENNFRFMSTKYKIQMAENVSCRSLHNRKNQPVHNTATLALEACIQMEFSVHL